MIVQLGKHRHAKIMVPDESDIEEYSKAQIQLLCDMKRNIGDNIVLMPDVHPGKVSTIGLTMNVEDSVIMPILLGPDIGCGVTTVPIKGRVHKGEFQKIDKIIREYIPSGMDKQTTHANLSQAQDAQIRMGLFKGTFITLDEIAKNLGTLGGGNHFIELDRDMETGTVYITVHTGSRNIGAKIYENYMNTTYKFLKEVDKDLPYEYTYVYGETLDNYISDVKRCIEFARLNRLYIIRTICSNMKWKFKEKDIIDCPHNYISNSILRKGSIAAYKDNSVVIPVNSRDGVIIGKGLGNVQWNCSAPHGAGRLIKRTEVANTHTVSEYKKIMEAANVYSDSINKSTLDEAPFAYRDLNYLKSANLEETISIEKILKPIYNFKAGDKE